MSNIISLNKKNIKEVISKAIIVLNSGGLVAYPTETFYALGVRFDDRKAIERLTALKGRPTEKCLPLIAGSIESVMLAAKAIDEASNRLIKLHWPGALSLLLPARENLPKEIVHRGKVAIRIPGESFALRLAQSTSYPIVSTSANPSGMPPSETAKMVFEYFGECIDLIIDGGNTPGGLPSTIVDATGGELKVIREGAIKISASILKSSFIEIEPFIDRYTTDICPHCEKVCCIDRHGSYEAEDIAFLRALGQSPPDMKQKPSDTEPCRYLGAKGCSLPRWLRPFRCTWYFCLPLLEYIYSEDSKRYRDFVIRLRGLLEARKSFLKEITLDRF